MITPPVDGQPNGGNPNIPPGTIPSDNGGYGYPPGTILPGGNPYGTTPLGCGNIQQGGGDPGMVPGGGYGFAQGLPPFGVLQGGGAGIIPYCGGPGSRRISGGSTSIDTVARSSIPITIILSSLVVLLLHMTMSPVF